MKKKLAVATTAVLAMTMCLSMTACKDKASVGALLPKVAGKYSTTVTTITEGFSSTTDYEASYADSNGVVILKKSAKNTSIDTNAVTTYYTLYNVAKNTTVIQDQAEPISRINDTLYYTENLVENTYTLYDSASGVYASGVEGMVDEEKDIFVRKNGARIYVAPNGTVKEETNPFEKIVSSDADEVGDYYLDGNLQSGILDVYNEKGDLKHSVNLMVELNVSANAKLSATWAIGNKLFFQTTRVLPEAEEEYDYYVADTKIDLDTYSYDLKKGSGKELKNFEYLIDTSDEWNISYPNDNTVIAKVQKITDGSLSQSYVQSFNANGKVAVDLQKLVPGAIDCEVVEDKIALIDTAGYGYIYKGSKRVATIPNGYGVRGNYVYRYDRTNNTLNVYDFKGNAVLNVENVVNDYYYYLRNTYDGNLIYSVKPETTETTPVTYASLYVFDTKTGISNLIGTNSESVTYNSFNSSYYYTVRTGSGETATSATHFYGCDTVINGIVEEIARTDDTETGKSYCVYSAEANGVTTYYSVVVTSPYVK